MSEENKQLEESENAESKPIVVSDELKKQIRDHALLLAFDFIQKKQIAKGLTARQHAAIVMKVIKHYGGTFPTEEKKIHCFWAMTKVGNSSAVRQSGEKRGFLKKGLAGEYIDED